MCLGGGGGYVNEDKIKSEEGGVHFLPHPRSQFFNIIPSLHRLRYSPGLIHRGWGVTLSQINHEFSYPRGHILPSRSFRGMSKISRMKLFLYYMY